MSIHLSRRWVALLALPFALAPAMIHLSTAVAANAQTVRGPQTAATARPAFRMAQRSRIQRIRFAPNSDSATIKTSVINGTRDIYLLDAQKGQTMSVRIVSLEDNAVFDITTPPNQTGQRRTLKQEAVVWTSRLPETGDYQVIVGTTRGNASYRLQITIK